MCGQRVVRGAYNRKPGLGGDLSVHFCRWINFRLLPFQVLSYHASAQQSEVDKIMVRDQYHLKSPSKQESVPVK